MHPLLKVREWIYEKGLRKSIALPAFTVSVGNISMGGTGKSPFTAFLCGLAQEKKKQALLLSRGYARKEASAVLVKAGGELPDASVVGDEPWMIKARHPEIHLLVHPDRSLMASRQWKECHADCVFLDDAFQHWRAVRDLDIVLVDAHSSLTQNTLPLGRLREPKEALRRADILLLTRGDEVSTERKAQLLSELKAMVALPRKKNSWRRNLVPQTTPLLLEMNYGASALHSVHAKAMLSCESLRGRECILVSGIAKAHSFRKSVESCGGRVVEEICLADHSALLATHLQQVSEIHKRHPEAYVLLTEKDWARWQTQISQFPENSFYLAVELVFAGNGLEHFRQKFWSAYECTKF